MFSVILCDTDEVILEWHSSFHKWIILQDGFTNLEPLSNQKTLEDWLNSEKKQVVNLIKEFNSSSIFMDLKPYEHAHCYIPRLYDKGFRFIAITACGASDWTHKVRWKNLQRYFPNMFIGLHCIELGHKKTEFLNVYRPTIWVEDSFSHAVDGAKCGHQSFLFNYPHNEGLESNLISRVDSWKDIYNLVTD
jgi:hypothetical protein